MFAGLSSDLLKKLLEASVAEHNSLARCVCVVFTCVNMCVVFCPSGRAPIE